LPSAVRRDAGTGANPNGSTNTCATAGTSRPTCIGQADAGYFWYQCRNDDLIICGGYNIAGPEVENVLLEHDAVIEAAVVASPDPLRGAVPKAFIVLKDGIAPSPALVTALQIT